MEKGYQKLVVKVTFNVAQRTNTREQIFLRAYRVRKKLLSSLNANKKKELM
jgi:hypothetical protein